jgi:DNA-binding NarL/FixJ family response regulator
MHVAGEYLMKDGSMTRFYLADSLPEERSALKVEVMDEASDWLTTLALAPESKLNMQLVDWSLFPLDSKAALTALRTSIVIVLTNHLDDLKQAAQSSGAEACIGKSETPERVAEGL